MSAIKEKLRKDTRINSILDKMQQSELIFFVRTLSIKDLQF